MRDNSQPQPARKTPIWRAIANALRDDIADRRYAVNDKLPTEAELAERFGVNRHTVRRALGQLVEDGLIRTRRGAGAYVSAPPTDYPIGQRVRFHENLIAAGRHPEKKSLSIETRNATEGEAKALAVAPGTPVCAYHGLSLADDQPIALFLSLFPMTRLPQIDQALIASKGVTEALATVGVHDYTRASTRLTAVLATATQAIHLQIQEGQPLLRTTAVNIDVDGLPIEYGRTWFAGDRVTLTL